MKIESVLKLSRKSLTPVEHICKPLFPRCPASYVSHCKEEVGERAANTSSPIDPFYI
jgi:hypothetical protein